MISIIYVIFSFILDGFISNYQNFQVNNISYLNTIYTIISLILVYDYFNNKKKYLYLIIIIGFLFDITYTGTIFINILLFFIICLVSSYLDEIFPQNIIMINIKTLIGIFIYYSLSYLLFIIFNYNHYELNLLWNILLRSIIMTIIYTSISYYLLKKIIKNKIK